MCAWVCLEVHEKYTHMYKTAAKAIDSRFDVIKN